MARNPDVELGFSHPLRKGGRAYYAQATGERKIRDAIWQVLSTVPGERVMRPSFGCRIHLRAFQPNDAKLSAECVDDIKQALGAVRGIVVESVTGSRPSANALALVIRYRIGRSGPPQTFDEEITLGR